MLTCIFWALVFNSVDLATCMIVNDRDITKFGFKKLLLIKKHFGYLHTWINCIISSDILVMQLSQIYCILNTTQMIIHYCSFVIIQFIMIVCFAFQSFVKKKTVDTKIMSALLTGVNRAYPFTKGGNKLFFVL